MWNFRLTDLRILIRGVSIKEEGECRISFEKGVIRNGRSSAAILFLVYPAKKGTLSLDNQFSNLSSNHQLYYFPSQSWCSNALRVMYTWG